MRENLHKGFRFRRQNVFWIIGLAGVFPYAVFRLADYEFRVSVFLSRCSTDVELKC
jgi:hypothetical protein